MAEEKKGVLDTAKEMLGGNSELVEKAKGMAASMLENSEELKKKAVEMGKAIAPDSLDDKVESAVNTAVEFLKENLGKKG